MREPKTPYPTGGLLVPIEDTIPIIYHGIPRLIVQDANDRVTLRIQSPLRAGSKNADADAGSKILDTPFTSSHVKAGSRSISLRIFPR